MNKDDLIEISKAKYYLYNKIMDNDLWGKIGFSLASLGEQGRQFFMDISLNQKKYDDTEKTINRKFDNILKSNRGDSNIGTFLFHARKYGYKGEISHRAGKDRQIKPIAKKINIKTAVDPVLLSRKLRFIELFSILLNYPPLQDNYLFLARGLSRETIVKAGIKSLNVPLNVIDDNNKTLEKNEDGKTIYNLDSNKGILKDLVVGLCRDMSEFEGVDLQEIKDFLTKIGILIQVKNSRFFRNYLQDYVIPCYDWKGNTISLQFTSSFETREKHKKKNLQKYYFLNSLEGEKAPLFYFPEDYKTYDYDKPLFITEGIIDSLSLKDSLFGNLQAIALYSANFTIDESKKEELTEVRKFKSIILLIEDDTAGNKAKKRLQECFSKEQTTVITVDKLAKSLNIDNANIKDTNDILKQIRAKQ